jgi:redox-sensitive bicupin YhaK (pirin superfamily)
VLNEDRIAPAHGFGTHPRRDMEMLTWVLEGALRHEDSLGTRAILKPGALQRLSAGTGVLHSEFNASDTEALHVLQIWMAPARLRLAPGYEQRTFAAAERRGRLTLLASADGRDQSVRVHQDVAVYALWLDAGDAVAHALAPDRRAWVQVTRGSVQLNGLELKTGDGAAVEGTGSLELGSSVASETLLFDLA